MRSLPKKRFGHSSPLRKLAEGAALGAGVGALALALHFSHLADGLEAKTWDLRARQFAAPSAASPTIKLVLLDQPSLDWARLENRQGWPWPREYHAALLRFLNRCHAKAVAFDLLYSEPSYLSVDDDRTLAEAIAANGRFCSGLFLSPQPPAAGGAAAPEPALKPQPFRVDGLDALPAAARARAGSFPIPEVADNAALLANTYGDPDPDGVFRRATLLTEYNGRAYPNLGLAAWALGTGAQAFAVAPGSVRSGALDAPVDGQGRLLLRYRGPSQTHRAYNAREIIRSELLIEDGQPPSVDPAEFAGCYVFFGYSAPALLDLRTSPTAAVYSGVEVNATVLDNLLAGDFMRDAAPPAVAAYLLALCLATALAVRFARRAWQNAAAFALALAVPVALAWAAYPAGWWLPAVVPELAALLALSAGFVYNYAAEGRQKKFIKTAFSQYLSPVVIDRLVEHPELLILGGETRESSILFSDVQGFTSISEKLGPEALTALLNAYLSEMTTVIYDHGGTIDKYEGDAIIAFWNAPLDLGDHAAKAVGAALECQRRLAEIRPRLRDMAAGHEVKARIGLNTGPVVIGNMGSAQRFNYTFFGDAGNLASRLEGINKQFGTYTMVSEFTKAKAGDPPGVYFREVSRVAVVGKKQAVTVYEPLPRAEAEARRAELDAFAGALALFYAGRFAEAGAAMAALAGADPVAAKYVDKIRELAADPPAAWDGVWVSTEK